MMEQKHFNSGDNVARDKFVTNKLNLNIKTWAILLVFIFAGIFMYYTPKNKAISFSGDNNDNNNIIVGDNVTIINESDKISTSARSDIFKTVKPGVSVEYIKQQYGAPSTTDSKDGMFKYLWRLSNLLLTVITDKTGQIVDAVEFVSTKKSNVPARYNNKTLPDFSDLKFSDVINTVGNTLQLEVVDGFRGSIYFLLYEGGYGFNNNTRTEFILFGGSVSGRDDPNSWDSDNSENENEIDDNNPYDYFNEVESSLTSYDRIALFSEAEGFVFSEFPEAIKSEIIKKLLNERVGMIRYIKNNDAHFFDGFNVSIYYQ